MQMYKVEVQMNVPENVEIWSWVNPAKHELLDSQLSPVIINVTAEPLPNNGYKFIAWYKDEAQYQEFLALRNTLPFFQERVQYELEHGITRTVISKGYVEIE
jgi:hypothetical protein